MISSRLFVSILAILFALLLPAFGDSSLSQPKEPSFSDLLKNLPKSEPQLPATLDHYFASDKCVGLNGFFTGVKSRSKSLHYKVLRDGAKIKVSLWNGNHEKPYKVILMTLLGNECKEMIVVNVPPAAREGAWLEKSFIVQGSVNHTFVVCLHPDAAEEE